MQRIALQVLQAQGVGWRAPILSKGCLSRHGPNPESGAHCQRFYGLPVIGKYFSNVGQVKSQSLHKWSPWSVTWLCTRDMAGHSKWANIKHTKAAKDSERARLTNDHVRKMRAFMRGWFLFFFFSAKKKKV
jgi:hypothetical protein